MLLAKLVDVSQQVTETAGRRAKLGALAALLRLLAPDEVEIAADYLIGHLRQGKIGLGWAAVREARESAEATTAPSLGLIDVDRAFTAIAASAGSGSAAERRRLLGALFSRASAPEADFLARLIVGELRQGALEGMMVEAVASAAGIAPALVRRAVMLAGEVPAVAKAALVEGAPGLDRFHLKVLCPVQPMLAQPADDLAGALTSLEGAALEWKLDGARVQVHKQGEVVRVYSRSLNDVTAAVPEIVEAVQRLEARELILDGEAIALAPSGAPEPFQRTMKRFGRTLDVPALRAVLPLSAFFFDVLRRDGDDLLHRPARERAAALRDALPDALRVPRLEEPSLDEAEAFFADALARGHEGVMAKSLAAPYEAGRRGSAWLKVKRAHTLDLVVLAAEWGSGRRRGLLSNIHLGARDTAGGGFVMLGKTFKGMTDEMLAWQTKRLLELEVGRDGHVVHVRPQLVVEIAFDGLQTSPQYPGGVALRFARVKHYRPDKSVASIATLEELVVMHRRAEGPAA